MHTQVKGFLFLGAVLVMAGCGLNKEHPVDSGKNTTGSKISFEQIKAGMMRLVALSDPNLDLTQMKKIFGKDFDENSKFYNAQTQSTEYKVYPYGPTEKFTTVGFNDKEEYTYFVDVGGTKNPKPPRIVKVRDMKIKSDQ